MVCLASAEALPGGGNVDVAVGFWSGEVTCRIGGRAWTPETGSVMLPDRISELVFPLEVACLALTAEWRWPSGFGAHASVQGTVSDPAAKMKDSDWDLDGRLWVYSESSADLEAFLTDAGVRYWFGSQTTGRSPSWNVGVGPGVQFGRLAWTVHDTVQTYPAHPWLGVDEVSGRTITYDTDLTMWYTDVAAVFNVRRFSGRAELASGVVVARDKDDHLLRFQRSTAELTGIGVRAALEGRVAFGSSLFGAARVSILLVEATGTSRVRYYAGENVGWHGKIDEDLAIASAMLSLGLGWAF